MEIGNERTRSPSCTSRATRDVLIELRAIGRELLPEAVEHLDRQAANVGGVFTMTIEDPATFSRPVHRDLSIDARAAWRQTVRLPGKQPVRNRRAA